MHSAAGDRAASALEAAWGSPRAPRAAGRVRSRERRCRLPGGREGRRCQRAPGGSPGQRPGRVCPERPSCLLGLRGASTGQPDRPLTVRWARPPGRGRRRRRRRRGRLARPRCISPPCRGSGDAAAAAALAAGSPHVSRLPRNSERRDVTLPWQRPPWFTADEAGAATVPETCPPAHAHRARPRAVPAAPGSRESRRSGRCQATSSGPAALTPGGVPRSAPAHNGTVAFPRPS